MRQGLFSSAACWLGLAEHVRDPFAEVQLAVWGIRGLGNMIARSTSMYGNWQVNVPGCCLLVSSACAVQVDRYGYVQDSACEIAGHLARLQNSLHEYTRAVQGIAMKHYPSEHNRMLIDPK